MRKQQLVLFIFSLIFLCLITSSIFKVEKQYNNNELETIETNIRKALVTCYASEGFYPSSLDYLKDNYGLIINDSVNVFYQAVGSNIFPDIMVAYKEKK